MTRRIENSIEVPGTPEAVWEAVATGPGIEAWFVPARVADGRVALDMGDGMADAGRVTASEPPRRFAYEEQWATGRLASEFLVEARSGGTCVVRLISTLDADGSDDLLEQLHKGWEVFLLNLRAYLTWFPGRQCSTVLESSEGDWPAFAASLGLDGARVGERVDAPRLAGVVEYAGERELQLRLDAPEPGLALVYAYDAAQATKTVLHLYLFGNSSAN